MKKIFVKPTFRQQEGDIVVDATPDFVVLEVEDETLYAEYIVEPSDAVLRSYAKAQKESFSKNIEDYIYAHYSEKKQAQDEKWTTYYTTSLKAKAVENIELTVVQKMTQFFEQEKSFEELLEDIEEEYREAFENMIKIAIKTQWAKLCIDEAKLATKEGREIIYPTYPFENKE